MSYVALLSESQTTPALQTLFEQLRANFGFLPTYFQALARIPGLVEAHQALAEVILADHALPAGVKEQAGMVTSGINSSSYCIAMHLELLRKFGIEKPLGQKLATDYGSAPVGEKQQALFRFADKLTRTPADISRADVEALRQAGWDEAALLEAVVTVAWFNFINRVALGLGLVG